MHQIKRTPVISRNSNSAHLYSLLWEDASLVACQRALGFFFNNKRRTGLIVNIVSPVKLASKLGLQQKSISRATDKLVRIQKLLVNYDGSLILGIWKTNSTNSMLIHPFRGRYNDLLRPPEAFLNELRRKSRSLAKGHPVEIDHQIQEKLGRYTSGQRKIIERALSDFKFCRVRQSVAKTVLLKQLEAWGRFPIEAVVEGLYIYTNRKMCFTGKDERYALGIIRSIARKPQFKHVRESSKSTSWQEVENGIKHRQDLARAL